MKRRHDEYRLQRQDALEERIAVIEGELNIPSPTETPRPTKTAAPTATSTPTPRPTATPTTRPTVAAGSSFTVARETVNVRSGPGTNYPVVGRVSQGQTFTPDGRNQAGDWLRFSFTGGQGWVYAPLMTLTGMDSLPVVNAPPATPAPRNPRHQQLSHNSRCLAQAPVRRPAKWA